MSRLDSPYARTSTPYPCARSVCRLAVLLRCEDRLSRLGHLAVALPAFVLQGDRLDSDAGAVGVELRQRFERGDPAAGDLVRYRHLSAFVVDLDGDIAAE